MTALGPTGEALPDAAPVPATTAPVDLSATTQRLMREFEGRIGLPTISRVVRDCARDLTAAPAGAQPELVERSARQRLTDQASRTAAAS